MEIIDKPTELRISAPLSEWFGGLGLVLMLLCLAAWMYSNTRKADAQAACQAVGGLTVDGICFALAQTEPCTGDVLMPSLQSRKEPDHGV